MKGLSTIFSLSLFSALPFLALSTSPPSDCQCYGPNLLVNGNFEEPTITGGWKKPSDFDDEVAYIHGNDSHEGIGALIFDFNKKKSQASLNHGFFNLPRDAGSYKISGYVKKEDGCKGSVSLSLGDKTIKTFEFGDKAISDWQPFEYVFSASDSPYSLRLYGEGSTGSLQFDDIEVRRCNSPGSSVPNFVENCGECLLKNPNFAQTDSWDGEKLEFTSCPNGKFGTTCIALDNNDEISQAVSLEPNAVYRISGAFQGNLGSGISVVIAHGDDLKTYNIPRIANPETNSVFRETFESDHAGDATITIKGDGDDQVYLDYITVTRLDCHSLKDNNNTILSKPINIERRHAEEL